MRIMSESTRHPYPEGKIATVIERQTARLLPSDIFMWAAGASVAAALLLKVQKRDHEALFVGQWAPTLLLFGVYNKMVKLLGSD